MQFNKNLPYPSTWSPVRVGVPVRLERAAYIKREGLVCILVIYEHFQHLFGQKPAAIVCGRDRGAWYDAVSVLVSSDLLHGVILKCRVPNLGLVVPFESLNI